MKYFVNSKYEFSIRMLLELASILVILPKTLSSSNYLPDGGSQYPYVLPSPSVSHEKSSVVMHEKDCFVARFCDHKIHKENFSCKVSEYVISNGLERTLPKWLWFDKENQKLKGIPSQADEGVNEILIIGLRKGQNNPVNYICGLLTVKIIVWSIKYIPLFTQDLPTSPVLNDRFSKPAFDRFNCQITEPIVLASLVLAGNFHQMDGRQKINVLDRLLESYHISIYDVFMLSNSEDSLLGLLHSSHVLASGPGANRSASGLTTTITWHVRCGVIHLDDVLFQVMQKLSEQLTFINNVSYGPIGWHVITGFQKRHVRRRRNIAGTTTPAYSTIPISRATVITTKIKITKTTYVSRTNAFTWSRPMPTFSSPYTNNGSVSLSLTSWSSQYRVVISTSPLISSSSAMFTPSQIISPSNQKSEISQNQSVTSTPPVMSSRTIISPLISTSSLRNASHSSLYRSVISTQSRNTTLLLSTQTSYYESVSSNFSVMSRSRNKSVLFQPSTSKEQTSSHSTKTSSQIHTTSSVTRLDSLFATSQLSSTFIQSINQNSTYAIVPSSRIITSSLPPTIQTVTKNPDQSSTMFYSLSAISSLLISSLFSTANYLTSTSKVSGVLRTTVVSKAIINETESGVNKTSGGSTPLIKTTTIIASTIQRSYTIDPSYSFYISPKLSGSSPVVQRSSQTPSTFLPCSNSCSVSLFSMKQNITSASRVLQYTKTPSLESSITSDSVLSSYGATRTFVFNTTNIASQRSDIDKTAENTSPLLTSGKVSLLKSSRESYDYITSKIIKTLTTSSSIQSSRLDIKSTKTIQVSSRGLMSSQVTSNRRVDSKRTSMSVVRPSSTVKSLNIMTSQSSSEYSTMMYTPTEQLTNTHSSLIKTPSASMPTVSVQGTTTIPSGSLIINTVPKPSIMSSFTSRISVVISANTTLSGAGHSSMSFPYTLTGSNVESASPIQTSRTLSPYMSLSSLRGFPHKSSSSNEIFEKSTTVLTTTPSLVVPPSHQASFSIITQEVLSSYTTATLLSVIPIILSSDQLSSHTTESSSTVATITPSNISSSYTTASLTSTVLTITPLYILSSYTAASSTSTALTIASSSIFESRRTSSSLAITTTLSFHSLSSFKTGTSSSVVTTFSSAFVPSHTLSSTLSFPTISSSVEFFTSPSKVIPIQSPPISTLDQLSYSQTTKLKSSTAATMTSSPYLPLSYTTVTSTSLSSLFTVISTPSFHSLSFNKTDTSASTIAATTLSSEIRVPYNSSALLPPGFTNSSLSYLSLRHQPTSLSNLVTTHPLSHPTLSPAKTASLSVFPSSYYTPTSRLNVDSVTSLSKLMSYDASASQSSLVGVTTSLHFLTSDTISNLLPLTTDYASSYYNTTMPSSAITTHSPDAPSSYDKLASLPVTTTTPSSLQRSYPTTTSAKSLSESSLAAYKTFSLSFLSSSIASSQTSFSSDLSMLVHSTGSSMSRTLTKMSSQTSWFNRPSYSSRQSPRTTAASIDISAIKSSSGLHPSSTSSRLSSSAFTSTTPSQEPPKIYNNFDRLRVTVGKVFSVQIPVDTFHDREDGNTRNLRLECLTLTHAKLPGSSWLQFNSTTQTLYGLVLKSQLGKISSDYFLTASDNDGNSVYDAFTVVFEESSKLLAAMFSVKLTGINLEMFNRDINNALFIVQTIAAYYGDQDESMIQVLSLAEGSVIFTWSNTTLQNCNKDLINNTASKLITKQGNMQTAFYKALSSKFIAEDVFVNYTGPCVVQPTKHPSISELSSHETSPWLKYGLPAFLVAVIIVVIVVALLLVRRHSGVKILKEDRQIYKRRKPIILEGEQEMSTFSGKPIQLPEDSLSPFRFTRESSLGTPEYDEDDILVLLSPISPAPSYQRLPPNYSDGSHNRYNTPPPPYKLPPSY